MDIQLLEDIGLTVPQAHAYKTLVTNGTLSAPSLAKLIGESRTNGYKILDKLCEYGLVLKQEVKGKLMFAAASPAALEQLVRSQAEVVRQKERRLNIELPHLLDYYFAHSERPSIRYFEGQEGIVGIYKDQLLTQQPMYFIRATADMSFMGYSELHYWRNMFPRFKIDRHAIVPDVDLAAYIPEDQRMPVLESDKMMRLQRTWINEDDYNAPVEWTAYGNKLSIISYGEEAMGMVIESPMIADAFRQLFQLLDEGIRRRPDYKDFPRKLTYTTRPDKSVQKASKNNLLNLKTV